MPIHDYYHANNTMYTNEMEKDQMSITKEDREKLHTFADRWMKDENDDIMNAIFKENAGVLGILTLMIAIGLVEGKISDMTDSARIMGYIFYQMGIESVQETSND